MHMNELSEMKAIENKMAMVQNESLIDSHKELVNNRVMAKDAEETCIKLVQFRSFLCKIEFYLSLI
ncbi:hypothetical protein CYV26_06925 [Carnobacterium maltaromaticum]|nr:hypothetical protein CYV30_09925 [Carnobacterium maltaromaticum]PLS35541.1 hypothetical protein CYV31_09905 [Carnobacterium maltaromaticum]PLS35991.1 hypothetical protein CYV33_06920 [Carnobacterium maltaromaticum]PLS42449.1 hypothetical protein CYV28_09865 [Carnobacterium maltaromaticum]PLS45469.1 hypothetical protein CYV27_06915 [Carnobacterium maltaromaticum]